MIVKIISGGQTGADQGGLYAAKELGLETGGTMPKGFRTQLGPNPDLAKQFNLKEHISPSYVPRTAQNIRDSDATIVFGNLESSGSKLTIRLCKDLQKFLYTVEWKNSEEYIRAPKIFQQDMEKNNVRILNVAGNREEINPGIFNFVKQFLVSALS